MFSAEEGLLQRKQEIGEKGVTLVIYFKIPFEEFESEVLLKNMFLFHHKAVNLPTTLMWS